MKMKLLSAAMLAGLGVAGSAQAVHVNPDGLGQVLLYPYYTTQAGFDTYVHVVNTSSTEVKAVKVRILEGKNSQEVLDFNLYLSPNDEWTGVITRTATGAGIASNDTSCVAPAQLPALGGTPQAFRNFKYTSDSVNGTDRTREGYIEVIEMGVVADGALATAATHGQTGPVPAAVPANCAAIRTAALPGGVLNNQATGVVTNPTGGLYGFASLINVTGGMKTSYDAVALDNFFASLDPLADLHYAPGDVLPGLDQVNTDADVLNGNAIVTSAVARGDIDAVSMVLMHDTIMNDYAVDAGRNSKTDWVITFPTKRFYVNAAQNLAARAPFENLWSTATSTSCDPITLTYYDREEQLHTVTTSEDFSPRPPVVTVTNNLCNEVNTLTIKPSGAAADYAGLFGASFTNASFTLVDGYTAGWMAIDFNGTNAEFADDAGLVYAGLPAVGFAAISNANNTMTVNGLNVLSNYMSSVTHKATRSITNP